MESAGRGTGAGDRETHLSHHSDTEDNRQAVFLFQRLYVALQRGNAVSFLGTFPQALSAVAVLNTFC